MAVAFPGQSGMMVEITAFDVFVDVFADRALRKQVLQKSPATLAVVLTWAIRIEAIDESYTPDTPASFDCNGHKKDHAFSHAIAPQGTFSPTPPLDDVHHLELSFLSTRQPACTRPAPSRTYPASPLCGYSRFFS